MEGAVRSEKGTEEVIVSCYEEKGICGLHGSHWPCTARAVTQQVLNERAFQFLTYGDNRDNEWGNGPEERWALPISSNTATVIEEMFREHYDETEARGAQVTWVQLIREELAEAFKEDDPDRLQRELIQVAALCVSWVEKIRESRQWGVSTAEGTIVADLEWHSPDDVLRGSHYHGVERVRVYSRYPGEEWREYR